MTSLEPCWGIRQSDSLIFFKCFFILVNTTSLWYHSFPFEKSLPWQTARMRRPCNYFPFFLCSLLLLLLLMMIIPARGWLRPGGALVTRRRLASVAQPHAVVESSTPIHVPSLTIFYNDVYEGKPLSCACARSPCLCVIPLIRFVILVDIFGSPTSRKPSLPHGQVSKGPTTNTNIH